MMREAREDASSSAQQTRKDTWKVTTQEEGEVKAASSEATGEARVTRNVYMYIHAYVCICIYV